MSAPIPIKRNVLNINPEYVVAVREYLDAWKSIGRTEEEEKAHRNWLIEELSWFHTTFRPEEFPTNEDLERHLNHIILCIENKK